MKYWAAADRFIGVFVVALIVWKHFYLMFKFQRRFLWRFTGREHRTRKWIILQELCWHLHRNNVLCYHMMSGGVNRSLWLKSFFTIFIKAMTTMSGITRQGPHTEDLFLYQNHFPNCLRIAWIKMMLSVLYYHSRHLYYIRTSGGQCAIETVFQIPEE